MEAPNPRTEFDNLSTIYAWSRRHASPDENPYATPADFFRDWLERLYPDTEELSRAIDEWPDSGLGHRIGSYPVDTMMFHDYTPADFLYDALSEQPEAFAFLSAKMPVRTLYVLDHSVVRYSTTPFNDPWDSGAVGIAFVSPDDMGDLGTDTCLAAIDAEVGEYDRWVNGEYDEAEDWFDYTGLRCPECGNTREFQATDVQLTGKTVINPDGWDWTVEPNDADFAPGCHIICSECGHEGPVDEFSGKAPATPAVQPPIGTVIMKGACAVDAKGADVFCGDVVVDSFCNEHKVIALEPIDAGHCWLIDESKVRLVPHLVEKVG